MRRDGVVPAGVVAAGVVPDLIVLAGGSGSRLGGVDKAAVTIAGRTLLSRALDARALTARTVVVGPESSRPAAGAAAAKVLWALEDPPLGGPAAGVAAGLAALERDAAAGADAAAPTADWVLLLACDLPWAADAARILLDAAEDAADAPADAGAPDALDGIHLVDADGRDQWLAGLYRASALRAAVRRAGADVRGARMRDLLAGFRLRGIRDDSNAGKDVDTWQAVAATEVLLASPANTPANPPAPGSDAAASGPACG
ncbi:Molybdopterin-guanine dinucleotide biosynthesis protein A [Cryobacterium psychrotolerans]|uniref:Molybdopterin-guanine dinucleotide biosynthesis protein A n=2 Tax=Cryobacterium TaxID=69578 RepID=A0A1G9FGT4_9MICO|nr:NTP transferase domain-containing protein [Cryobacterium psychrotolerans]SDK87557.1 Molybdopterin-guanine dinucleotide biosynthesis protein A [Cryobacterium psychrotolerans]